MSIRALIEAVERGEFITGILQSHETVAYAAFSGSLDAALALHDALLPGWDYCVDNVQRAPVMALVQDDGGPEFCGENAIPARAWLLAILRAVEAEGQL